MTHNCRKKHPGKCCLPFLFKVTFDSINVSDAKALCLRSVITTSAPSVQSSSAKAVWMLLKSGARSLCWSTMWATRPRGHSKNVTSLVERINRTCAQMSFQAERTFFMGGKTIETKHFPESFLLLSAADLMEVWRLKQQSFSCCRAESPQRRPSLAKCPSWLHCHRVLQGSWSSDRLDDGELRSQHWIYISLHLWLRWKNEWVYKCIFFLSCFVSAGFLCRVCRVSVQLPALLFQSSLRVLAEIRLGLQPPSCRHVGGKHFHISFW